MFAENLSEVTIGKKNGKGEQNQRGQFENNNKIFEKSNISKKKSKAKKNKKEEMDTQNISVKSSFNKFEALQKKNVIHVRSINASKAHEKFSNPQGEVLRNCHLCDKVVYKMEEVKAEKNNYHKNCFRCHECKKQLKVDTYQSHQGVLYCSVHFKLLFIPKSVEEDETVQPSKPELIICESEPTELPPDVIRASDKPDLGLEELKQLNVLSRFQVFEHTKIESTHNLQKYDERDSNNVIKGSSKILSKLAELQQLSSSSNKLPDNEDKEYSDLKFAKKKLEQKSDSPVGIGEAMSDILCLFEKGHGIRKEERREERKQEIQNIRSRLFLGKQARIKEMYQQAVADSENVTDKKLNIEIEVDSRSLRSRFENGAVFNGDQTVNENDDCSPKSTIEKEADVFESAISKKSRSIFMELDANVVTAKNQTILPIHSNNKVQQTLMPDVNINHQFKNELDSKVVKCDEAEEDLKMQTSELSEKFKFFEKYRPSETKKSVFRITPPREGVVKMPSSEENDSENEKIKDTFSDEVIIGLSRTTSMMVKKFKELESNPNRFDNKAPKPLKCFTPPPDGNRRLYIEQDSDEYASNDDDEEEDNEDESNFEEGEDDNNDNLQLRKEDESLREAQNAAKAKELKIKFERWQANEIKEEENEIKRKSILLDENSLESTRLIRERFEKMKNAGKFPQTARPRCQVKRFV